MGNKRTYRAKAVEWGMGLTGTGKEQIAVNFQILTEGASHQTLTWYGFFTDATADRTIESLRHMGWKGEDLAELVSGNQGGLDANEVDLVVEDVEFEGRTTTKVQWVNRANSGGLALKTQMDPGQAKTFAALMRDRIRAVDASNGTRKATPTKTPAQPNPATQTATAPLVAEDDLPF